MILFEIEISKDVAGLLSVALVVARLLRRPAVSGLATL